jgi:hypothetical protein
VQSESPVSLSFHCCSQAGFYRFSLHAEAVQGMRAA